MTVEPVEPFDALQNVDLFEGLEDEMLTRLVEVGETRQFQPGSIVVEQGSEEDFSLYAVLDGVAQVHVNDERRATLYPGDYFGEVSFFDRKPRSYEVVADDEGDAKDLTLFVLTPSNSLSDITMSPEFLSRVVLAFCARQRDQEFYDVTWAMKILRGSVRGMGWPYGPYPR
jgi:signal-transduction protein with cAMP-binding, CBS, and nucleotidyltransferase domain